MPNSIHQHDIHLQTKFFFQVGILSFGALAGCEKGYPSGQVCFIFFYIYLSGQVCFVILFILTDPGGQVIMIIC